MVLLVLALVMVLRVLLLILVVLVTAVVVGVELAMVQVYEFVRADLIVLVDLHLPHLQKVGLVGLLPLLLGFLMAEMLELQLSIRQQTLCWLELGVVDAWLVQVTDHVPQVVLWELACREQLVHVVLVSVFCFSWVRILPQLLPQQPLPQTQQPVVLDLPAVGVHRFQNLEQDALLPVPP
jgi:hypothetical protein